MRIAYRRLEGRDGHEAGRELLAELYRQETGQALPEIRVTERGKPFFPEGGRFFSVSHTKNHVFCCLSRKNVGIDAEETDRQVRPGLAERILSQAEAARYQASPEPREALLRLWVLKEAYAKLTGRGLGEYLRRTDFDPDDPRVTQIDGCYVAVLEE